MVLTAGCPRCPTPMLDDGVCAVHGAVPTLWRAEEASYDALGEVLARVDGFPTYLPWPLRPGWSVTDVGVVDAAGGGARATVTCCSGSSELDGPVDVLVVAEEAGTGLGARCAGSRHGDPGPEVSVAMREGITPFRVRTDWQQVSLWPVSTSDDDVVFDRSVVAGEADGRWLWMVLRPASALLLLREEWTLRDVSSAGPEMLDLSYGGPRPDW